ncbi:DUF3857 and transglutaminase domain-containing protein [Cytophagaceae bacterium DM2B3-1]|uniref:DUF3857 and transglutaminase domain-containing protein n=1 Tax=Xanthocytophaga flava TaxID=3048013 RepID=A0ABT7CIA1_9BACT|nr:DUF3857 and transglutaminase domain-containing protein [Xanthocytophaga flavus]MDJ1468525.1 DUF3857 and transglutaminase domain-containing protein [Xanthocytophaga flavus]MDJ1493420.1 DUF3857 and transglutaminase domain-containing protein [Xanthocytophaga flavus]
MKRRLLFLFISLCIYSITYSQSPIKWGKISDREAKLSVCPFDSAASAVVLADYGRITIDYNNVTIERHKRIKILDKKGLDRANMALQYYAKDRIENIDKVEAQTITVDKSGKAIITEVPKNQIFDVDASVNWREKRFTFPSVEVGSIIEYRSKTTSQNYTFLEGWFFQADIPTLHSEMSVNIQVQDMDYRVLLQGERLMTKYQSMGDKPVSTWMLENLPALVEESYVANHYDYAEKVRFQLAGYKAASKSMSGGVEYKNVMTTWEKLADQVLLSTEYDNFLNRAGKAKDILGQVIAPADPDIVKVQKIYNYVKNTITWNGTYRVWPEQMFGKFLESKQGSNAEINLFLVLLLEEAGFKANPALVSARSHGKIQKSYALLSQFTHTLAYINLGGKDVLLDACDPLRPYQLLAKEDLNWAAFVLDKKESRWINIDQAPVAKETVYADINLENPQKPIYNFAVRYEGYKAVDVRRTYLTLGEEKFLDRQRTVFNDKKLIKFEKENQEKPDEYLLHTYQLVPEDDPESAKTLYFKPVMWHHFQENPFKGSKRNLPIELDYPESFQFILNLHIPDGYEIQEIPKSALVSLPDNIGVFRYQTSLNGAQFQLSTQLQIKSVFIPVDYYSHLQQFYDHVIGKFGEMIVLKKK